MAAFSWCLASSFGCGGGRDVTAPLEPVPSPPALPSSPDTSSSSAVRPVATAEPSPGIAPPRGKLRLREARLKMLALVNRDRATQGLGPLALDEGPAQRAGQRHAEDMAKNGFLGHYGTDGSVPEQRHTEAGGSDMVLENASCMDDLKRRELDPDPLVDEADIERAEHMFFDEVPPHDGHRKNILKPQHTRVGIGIALPRPLPGEIAVPCITHEMVDGYGTYGALPAKATVGATLRVEGALSGPAQLGGVGISRVDMPKPLPPAEANKRRSYTVPSPYETYWPKGFVTKIPVEVTPTGFRIDVPLSDAGKPGLYSVAIFGKLPGQSSYGMLSLRTITVAPK
ncbi:MAG: CAP domain-containing protein [Myxococcales bacterium]|nr:CAP domain-containing protein [Myxococcales bacterium]